MVCVICAAQHDPPLICNNNDMLRVTVTAADEFPRLAVCLLTHTVCVPSSFCRCAAAAGLELQCCCVRSLTQPSSGRISSLIGAPSARAAS